VLCAGGVAVLALAEAGEVALAVGVRLATLALLALVAAVVLGWSALVPASLVLLGAAYATRLYDDEVALDAGAPVLAAGLFLTAELGYWSLEERWGVRADAGDGLRHLGLVTLVALAGLIAAAVLLALADLARTGGLVVDLLGAVAAAAALLVVVLFARRPTR
jgi:hypothetical protein